MDVITPPPPSPQKTPHRVQRQNASRSWHVQKVERWQKKTLQKPMRNATHTGKQHSRRRSTQEIENTSRSRMDVITASSPAKPPQRVERQMQVEAGMRRKSRGGQNTANTDTKCDTDRKSPKKTMRNGQLSRFLDSAARRLIFC